MAYKHQQNVQDGETLIGEAGPNTTKGSLIHVKDNTGKARPLSTDAAGDIRVATQGQVLPDDPTAARKGSLLYVEDAAGNAQTLKTNADGDIPVAPRDLILDGDPVAGIKGPLIHVADDIGDATPLTLEPDGSVKVSQTQLPPPIVGQQNVTRFLTGSLGSAGIVRSGVTLQQGVDGSASPVEFYIGSHLDYDIHVMQITIVIGDSAVTHNNFGNVNPLTNGWTLEIQESGETYEIILNAKTGGELIAQSGFSNPFGDGLGSFELTNWDGNSDASIITIPIYQWLPNGLRIGRDSLDELRSRVNDDLTGLQHFEVRIFGFKNYPV